VAKCWRTDIPVASKNSGSCLSASVSPPTVPYRSVAGVVNPLDDSRYSSVWSGLVSWISTWSKA